MRAEASFLRISQFLIIHMLALSGPSIYGAAVPSPVPLSSFQLNGSARLTNSTLITLTNSYYQAGSAFLPMPYSLGPNDNFLAFFAYQAQASATGPSGDGLAFVVQNVGTNSAAYLGLSGSGLGFFTLTPIPALAVTVDFYTNAITGSSSGALAVSTPVGVNLSQTVPSLTTFPGESSYRAVWIQYYGAQQTLQVFYGSTMVRPATASLSIVLPTNLSTLLGGQVYFGITAGTGALYSSQEFDYFSVQVQNNLGENTVFATAQTASSKQCASDSPRWNDALDSDGLSSCIASHDGQQENH